jgi:hypothetical protein
MSLELQAVDGRNDSWTTVWPRLKGGDVRVGGSRAVNASPHASSLVFIIRLSNHKLFKALYPTHIIPCQNLSSMAAVPSMCRLVGSVFQ